MYELINKNKTYKYLFYRFPKALMKEEHSSLSLSSKVLYVLLLDRAGLSKKNKWYDKNGHVYVYFRVKEICKVLGIGKDKATRLLRELDDEYGVGLIRRVHRGQGRPDRIYVMSFLKGGEGDVKEEEEPLSEAPENGLLEGEENDPSLYNSKNEDIITTKSYHSYQDEGTRFLKERDDMRALIKENIAYDWFVKAYQFEKPEHRPFGSIEELDELVETMVEVICSSSDTIKVGKENIPHSVVKDRLLNIDQTHMEYILECISKTTTKISNPKAYNISVLYNAPLTMHSSISAEYRHDFMR